jgi:EC042_2821-lke REase/Protein of unknown function (DUF3644)
MRVTEAHKRLIELLQNKEAQEKSVSKDEIAAVTGWDPTTFPTYWAKGQFADFLSQIDENRFNVSNTPDLSVASFVKILSQSKNVRSLGHNCKSRLSKALLRKSRGNMLLALELYNRPSLENRMDAFVACFCIAWEQLLKAMLIERQGEQFIFKPDGKNVRIRETISLRDCLKAVYPDNNSVVRKNLERIAGYRDKAVHLLMPEVQGIMSRVFQSGVLNYSTEFKEFTEQAFIDTGHAGMLSLVGDMKSLSKPMLQSRYGQEIGDEIAYLAHDLAKESENENDIQFAIPMNVKLVYARNDASGNTVTLAKAEDGIEGLRKAIVLEKPTDRSRTHPFRETQAIKEINSRLTERYSEENLAKKLVVQDSKKQNYVVNSHCFRAIAHKLGWKKSTNKFHYKNNDPEYHYFSDAAIEEFIDKVMNNDDTYLERARQSYTKTSRKRS